MFVSFCKKNKQKKEHMTCLLVCSFIDFYSVLVSVSCPKALFLLKSDILFPITIVVADRLG